MSSGYEKNAILPLFSSKSKQDENYIHVFQLLHSSRNTNYHDDNFGSYIRKSCLAGCFWTWVVGWQAPSSLTV